MIRTMVAAVASMAATVGGVGCAANAAPRTPSTPPDRGPGVRSSKATVVHHYEYVFVDEMAYVYDIDHGFRLVQRIALPGVTGIRGVAASPRTHTLYISHGSDAGPRGHGSLLAYNLLSGAVVWDRTYDLGIDSMAIAPDGSRVYMPDGELSPDGVWSVIDAHSGAVIATIAAGTGPHNTIAGLSGAHVYLGGRDYDYLDVASTASDTVVKRIGPLRAGVRPFTINGSETVAYTTATGFLGFQASSIKTGRVLYTVPFGTYDASTFPASAPSHGISLAPDERELWVLDAPYNQVRVFDVANVLRHRPRLIATIELAHTLSGDQSSCSYDCGRDGWLLHSRSGCFVFVGDSGEVLSVRTRRQVAFLPALRNSREFLEIDWLGGHPIAATTRYGLGYVTHGPLPSPPGCR